MPVRLRRRKSKGGFYLLFYFILVGFPGVILKPFLFFLLPELIIFFSKNSFIRAESKCGNVQKNR